jgi:hypothetical protein
LFNANGFAAEYAGRDSTHHDAAIAMPRFWVTAEAVIAEYIVIPSGMARGSYKRTKFDYAIVDNSSHGWRVQFTIDGEDYDSHSSFPSEMLARQSVQAEARKIVDFIESKDQPGIPG